MKSPLLKRTFQALSYREFRVLWLGAFTSTVGTWMQKVAQSWLVLMLTGSAFLLGLDAFLGDAPILLFSLIGGVVADRMDRRRLLLTSQYLQMTFALILAALIYFDKVSVWHILLLSFLTGSAQAFGGPAYQALIPTLVQKKDLSNAIALSSIQFNLARIIGPVVAGLAFTAFGAAACFLLNGVSFLAVIFSLSSFKSRVLTRESGGKLLEELRSGLSFVRQQPVLQALSFLAFCSTFFGVPLITMLPVFARDVFQLGPKGYSGLLACTGVGAVIGALVVAALGNFQQKGKVALALQVFFGAMMILFSLSSALWLSLCALFLAGIALVAVFALITSLVQLKAPEAMRGRVVSIYMMAFRGGTPLGSLTTGFLASQASPAWVLAGNGLMMCLVGGTFLMLRQRVRLD
ncbi:MAG: MFS transporter [Acidobacteria bacterium]|nr:MFS transporter [Acidobacteriota bacterium]MCI0721426.1 MFS transporter [Acidobacteriota bacterium]